MDVAKQAIRRNPSMKLPGHIFLKCRTPRIACMLACLLLAGCASTPEVTQGQNIADPTTIEALTPIEEQEGAPWGWVFWFLCGVVILMMVVDRMKPGDAGQDTPAKRWFRANLKVIIVLLSIWAIVSFGCGILLAPWLNQFNLPGTGYKLGFWFAQQGSIYVFVLLIFAYVLIMNRLDRRHGVEED